MKTRSAGLLAGMACAAGCALPLLVTAGLLTGTGAVVLQQALLAVAAGLAVVAAGLWVLHRRRTSAAMAAAACAPEVRAATGCGGGCRCGSA